MCDEYQEPELFQKFCAALEDLGTKDLLEMLFHRMEKQDVLDLIEERKEEPEEEEEEDEGHLGDFCCDYCGKEGKAEDCSVLVNDGHESYLHDTCVNDWALSTD